MIKIRYACLPEGLHAAAVARGRHATIYLRPGLRPAQRRDALARLRRNSRLGYAPPLPAAGVAWALAGDRIRRTLRDVRGAVQCHPLGTLGVAGVLAGVAVSYMTLMTTPLPAGGLVSAGSLPAAGNGETAAAGRPGSAGLPASALVPLGLKPRPWSVPDARPRHRHAGQGQWRYGGRPGPHPPAHRGPRRRAGRRWPRRPSGGQWPSRDAHGWPPHRWRQQHGWPPHRWRQAHGWPPRHWRQQHGWPPHHGRYGTRERQPGNRQRPGFSGWRRPGSGGHPAGQRPPGGWDYYPQFRAWPQHAGPEWGSAGSRWG